MTVTKSFQVSSSRKLKIDFKLSVLYCIQYHILCYHFQSLLQNADCPHSQQVPPTEGEGGCTFHTSCSKALSPSYPVRKTRCFLSTAHRPAVPSQVARPVARAARPAYLTSAYDDALSYHNSPSCGSSRRHRRCRQTSNTHATPHTPCVSGVSISSPAIV